MVATQTLRSAGTSAPQIPPYSYCCLDLETADASPDCADRWMRDCWRPDTLSGEKSWKPETVAKRLQEMHAKKKEQLALMEESPIACIGIKADTEFRYLHMIEPHEPLVIEGATVQGFASEREMLLGFRALLNVAAVLPAGTNAAGMAMHERVGGIQTDTLMQPTVLVAHNGRKFDIPKLRTAFLRNGLQLPRVLIEEGVPLYDTMSEFSRRFAVHGDGFIGLDAIVELIGGIATHKHVIDGAEIPKLIAAKETKKVVTYGLLDLLKVENIFLRMTGHHPTLD